MHSPQPGHAQRPNTEASANSKICIFRIDGEGEHQSRLRNIHSDATRHNPTRWPAAIRPRAIVTACVALCRRANILQSIFVFTLSVKPKNKYFAICSRKLLRYWPALRASLCQTGRLLNITLGINRSAFKCNRRDLWVFGSPTTMSIACSGQNTSRDEP